MMLEVVMVMDMEDDKLADMVLMIPNEYFSGGTVAIGDTQWDDVRGNDEGIGGWQISNLWKWRHLVLKFWFNASGATWWSNFELMQVAPPGAQILN